MTIWQTQRRARRKNTNYPAKGTRSKGKRSKCRSDISNSTVRRSRNRIFARNARKREIPSIEEKSMTRLRVSRTDLQEKDKSKVRKYGDLLVRRPSDRCDVSLRQRGRLSWPNVSLIKANVPRALCTLHTKYLGTLLRIFRLAQLAGK